MPQFLTDTASQPLDHKTDDKNKALSDISSSLVGTGWENKGWIRKNAQRKRLFFENRCFGFFLKNPKKLI